MFTNLIASLFLITLVVHQQPTRSVTEDPSELMLPRNPSTAWSSAMAHLQGNNGAPATTSDSNKD